MKQKYPYLFRPITIRGITLKNRILSAPLGVWAISPENGVPESTIKFFEERAAGGAATVVLGDTQVNAGDPEEEKMGRILHLRTPDAPTALLTEFADRIHQHGAIASIELSHIGGGGFTAEGVYSYGPIAFKTRFGEAKAMTVEKIKDTIRQYAECAAAMKRSGFKMVTIHGGHDKLPDQFFSPSNVREDEYGGSLENRMRFVIEVIDAVRQAVGEEFIIELRVSSRDPVQEAERFEELVTLVNRLEGKVDIINASVAAHPGSETELVTFPGPLQPPAPNAMRAAALKARVNVPVSAVGAIITPEIAEEILSSGKADFVAMGRPLIADPNWPKKARRGRDEDIRPCIGCLKCLESMHRTHVIRCSVNPLSGKEYSTPPVTTAPEKRKVTVIGGGVAGMQAAIVAAGRGHEVTLFEKSDRLGGTLACFPKDDLKYRLNNLREYFICQINKSGVDIRLNTEATGQVIEELAPDVVIMASGSNPITLDIPGADGENVFDIREAYNRIDSLPKRIAIVGGNLSGCDLAASLNQRGHTVTVVEMAPGLHPAAPMMMDGGRLDRLLNGVTAETGAVCTEIRENGVIFTRDGEEHFVEVDAMILAVGMRANRDMAYVLQSGEPEYIEVGDCTKAATVAEAVQAGYFAALDI